MMVSAIRLGHLQTTYERQAMVEEEVLSALQPLWVGGLTVRLHNVGVSS